MLKTLHFVRPLLLAVATAGLLAACGGGDDDDFDDRADLADPTARFVHAVPGGPAVTLRRNGGKEPSATNVDYKYASQYKDIVTDRNDFALLTGPSDTVVATTIVDGERGNKYTLVALPATGGVELLAIDDPYNKSVNSDDARVRVLNASANAPALDVYITAPTVDLNNVAPTFAGLDFKEVAPVSGSDSVDLEGGGYQLRITVAGSKTPIFSVPVTVPQNADWLLVTLPDDGALATPNDIRVLLVRSDDSNDATDELVAP